MNDETGKIIIDQIGPNRLKVWALDGGYTINCHQMAVKRSVKTIKNNMLKGGYSSLDITVVNNTGIFFGNL